MSDQLLSKIRELAASQPQSLPFPVATTREVEAAEALLGLAIPPLLRRIYLEIGNGGFGPGYGIIGLEGGYASDLGTLIEARAQLKEGCECDGGTWNPGLLPFCEWGCCIFSCIDCAAEGHPISLYDGGPIWPKHFLLEDFFTMWIDGVDLLSHRCKAGRTTKIINPFTGEGFRMAAPQNE